ncbi:MAG: thiamine pyrophosphate-dependent enzyme [Thermomicrobiales bacterium]
MAGDAKLALIDLLDAIDHPERIKARHADRIAGLVAVRDHYWADVNEQAKSDSQPIKPQRLVKAMRDALDDDILIVADPGTPTPYLGAQFELRRAGRTTVIPRAHGGLGYAIPGVVGAHFAAEGRRVVGMTGDGSWGMSCGELETISRLNLPIVIIQCANNSYGWIKELQHLYHGDRYFGVDFTGVDYAAIAAGFGLKSWSIKDPADIETTLRSALDWGGPAFINVETESQITETPPVAAWTEAEERIKLGLSTEHHG